MVSKWMDHEQTTKDDLKSIVGAENLGFLKLPKKKAPATWKKPGPVSRFHRLHIYICRFESSWVSKIGGFFLE